MNIAGLDLSLRSAGIALGHTTLTVTKFAEQKGAYRLASYRNFLEGAVAKWADLVVIEGYSYSSVNGGERIGELGGVVRVMLHDAGVPYVEVQPSSLKKFATGMGKAHKDKVLACAIKAGADVDGNDAADAWWLRQMGVAHYDKDNALVLPAVQLDAITKVEWPLVEVKS